MGNQSRRFPLRTASPAEPPFPLWRLAGNSPPPLARWPFVRVLISMSNIFIQILIVLGFMALVGWVLSRARIKTFLEEHKGNIESLSKIVSLLGVFSILFAGLNLYLNTKIQSEKIEKEKMMLSC